MSSPLPSRVCDRCIRKKLKCNRGRPTCSRCFDLGETCSYTFVKRKPGPPLGSHYTTSPARKSRRSRQVPATPATPATPAASMLLSVSPGGGDKEDISCQDSVPASETLDFSLSPSSQPTPSNVSTSTRARHLSFPPQQVEYLLQRFFDIIKDANPIFSKELFFQRHRSSQCSELLITTIVVITAKLTGFVPEGEDDQRPSWDACLDMLLSSSLLQDDLIGDSLSLDHLRKAYLLAFYEFHQFPGHQSWLRAGRITRMAYRIGLDRLDYVRAMYPDWSTVSDQDIQEWRCLWWCIYRLDTYSNLSCGTPYLIDDAVIRTSFVRSQITQRRDSNAEAVPELSLPSNLEDLPKVLLAVPSGPETLLQSVHNITIATLRQTGFAIRLRLQLSQEDLRTQITKAERLLSTVRLALPTGWLNPRRNALSNESHADHHARTVTVLHLRMAQLLLAIANPLLQQDENWVSSWQYVVEACQDIAAVADQWDSSFCLAVDPAISFVIFTALAFLSLHRKMAALDPSLSADIGHHTAILHLQLQHFGSIWTVPRLLKLSYESFHQSVSAPLSSRDVAFILSRFEAPFHPRWLQFLSSANTQLESLAIHSNLGHQ